MLVQLKAALRASGLVSSSQTSSMANTTTSTVTMVNMASSVSRVSAAKSQSRASSVGKVNSVERVSKACSDEQARPISQASSRKVNWDKTLNILAHVVITEPLVLPALGLWVLLELPPPLPRLPTTMHLPPATKYVATHILARNNLLTSSQSRVGGSNVLGTSDHKTLGNRDNTLSSQQTASSTSTTASKPSLKDKLNPFKDADGDGKKGIFS